MGARGFSEWINWYDTCEVHSRPVPVAGLDWHRCLSSDLPRAIFTAEYLYAGKVEQTPLLREVPFSPYFGGERHMPLFLWQVTSRWGWLQNHKSQTEGRLKTKTRISGFLDLLMTSRSDQNILLVSHGFFMQFLAMELRKRGFQGRVPLRPRGGIIYLFEK
jgi:broad specificity phosphatase PhoE